MTVGRLVDELRPGEFQEMLAFDRLEPTPEAVHAAGIRATTMNSQGGKKGGGAFMPADFLPRSADAKPVQTEAHMKAMFTQVLGPPTPAKQKDE